MIISKAKNVWIVKINPPVILNYIHYQEVLTKREFEVFVLLLEGAGNQKIADQICVSYETVRSHRKNIFRKCRVHTIVQLIRCNLKHLRKSRIN
ncbi:MAG: helix-turn-helix transcriptional regulator [Chlorobi bacterium]|nr:helix-turn-helix transcriptional regulator [Chlorobiota bacterium]